MNWKAGPLPADTFGWGQVVTIDPVKGMAKGFSFADFHGDHATLVPGGRVVGPHDIAYYDNSYGLPPVPGVATRIDDLLEPELED